MPQTHSLPPSCTCASYSSNQPFWTLHSEPVTCHCAPVQLPLAVNASVCLSGWCVLHNGPEDSGLPASMGLTRWCRWPSPPLMGSISSPSWLWAGLGGGFHLQNVAEMRLHYSQQPKGGNNPNVQGQRNGWTKCVIYVQGIFSDLKRTKFWHLLRHGWTLKTLCWVK